MLRAVLVMAVLGCGFAAQAQHPDYSGTWILNLDKSRLEDPGKGLTGSRFIIHQEGESFR